MPQAALTTTSSGPRLSVWVLCRNRDEFPIEDENSLLRWTRQGRVRPDDYLVDLRLDLCCQARQLQLLAPIFRGSTAQQARRLSGRFALAALALVWFVPAAATLALLTAVVMALIYLREESCC